jgi:hypothetical protein
MILDSYWFIVSHLITGAHLSEVEIGKKPRIPIISLIFFHHNSQENDSYNDSSEKHQNPEDLELNVFIFCKIIEFHLVTLSLKFLLLGASRVLQAVAVDTMFGPFLSFVNKGTVKNNPVSAVLVTSVLVQVNLV